MANKKKFRIVWDVSGFIEKTVEVKNEDEAFDIALDGYDLSKDDYELEAIDDQQSFVIEEVKEDGRKRSGKDR